MRARSETRQEVLDFLQGWYEEYAYPATLREIAEGTGLRSLSSVHNHVRGLVEEGLVERLPGRRGYRPKRVEEKK